MRNRIGFWVAGAVLMLGAVAGDQLRAQDQLPEEGGCSYSNDTCNTWTIPEICID